MTCPDFLLGACMYTCQHPRLPERQQVLRINHIVYTNSLSKSQKCYQFKEWWEYSEFPDTSQAQSRANLESRPFIGYSQACYVHFFSCTHPHSFQGALMQLCSPVLSTNMSDANSQSRLPVAQLQPLPAGKAQPRQVVSKSKETFDVFVHEL